MRVLFHLVLQEFRLYQIIVGNLLIYSLARAFLERVHKHIHETRLAIRM